MTDSKLIETIKEEGFEELSSSTFDSSTDDLSGYIVLNSSITDAVEKGYKKIVIDIVRPITSGNYFYSIYGKK